ncbi:hypothetical protein EAH76_15235 [Sphingomonas glacialis]|uniref:Uncharacterized protein n=1 Tax=Sphingomonas glacialis TaxID=658225 RepID=A0A502FRN9_9SPHN|nr:hypothetical protein EAH76_15235 [Sphingomonas glacialis]
MKSALPPAVGPSVGRSADTPPNAIASDRAHLAWIAQIHLSACARWLASQPPAQEDAAHSLRAIAEIVTALGGISTEIGDGRSEVVCGRILGAEVTGTLGETWRDLTEIEQVLLDLSHLLNAR